MDIVRSSLKVFLSKIVTSLVSFVAIVVFSRELGASPLGTYYPFIALLGILAIPADFGLRRAAEKRLSEKTEGGSYLSTAILLKLPPLILISIIIFMFRSSVTQYLGADLVLLLIVLLFTHEAAKMSLVVLRGELRVGETAVIEVFQPLGWFVIGYFFITMGYGVSGLVYGYLGGNIAVLLMGWWKVSIRFARPTVQHAKSLIEFGKYSVVSAIGGYFYSWMDVTILTLFVSLEIASSRAEIGAYENAWRVSLTVLLLSRAIATTIFPQISRWDVEDATDRIEAVLPAALMPALLLVVPAFAGSVVLSREILGVLFGSEFTVAWLVLIVLMGEKVLQAIHIILGKSLQAINRPDLAAYATTIAIIVNLLLNVLLIWMYGIVGAAFATAISFGVNTILHAYFLREFIKIKFPTHEAFWAIGASVIMMIIINWVQSNIVINTLSELFAVIGFGAIIYGVLILGSHQIRMQIFDSVRRL